MRLTVPVDVRRSFVGLAAIVVLLLGLGIAASLSGEPALAQVQPAAEQAQVEDRSDSAAALGLWTRITLYIRAQQRDLHRELAGAMRSLRNQGSPAAAWSLIVLSFLYGVFHAAGPGHGKAVISAYLLTHESALKRGLWISTAAALVQGITAIVLVWLLVAAIGWAARDAQATVGTLESASFALIALLGAGLALRAAVWLWRGLRPQPVQLALAHAQDRGGPSRADHDHRACGHLHAADPARLTDALSWRTAAAMVLSVGIRPCSGAVLVLIFAEALGLRLAGLLAVLAMSLGTAITVGLLAILAVAGRRAALSLLRFDGGALLLVGQGAALIGGLVIALLGLSLFLASLGPAHPLL